MGEPSEEGKCAKFPVIMRIVNISSALLLVGFGLAGLIIQTVNNLSSGKFFLLFSPIFMILVGALFIAAEFSCQCIMKHFTFLKSYLGRGIFNLLYFHHNQACRHQSSTFSAVEIVMKLLVGLLPSLFFYLEYCIFASISVEDKNSNKVKPIQIDRSSNSSDDITILLILALLYFSSKFPRKKLEASRIIFDQATCNILMRKVLFRQPIHINIANKGKLRKIQHHKTNPFAPLKEMVLTPTDILEQHETLKKQKQNFYHRRVRRQESDKNGSESVVKNIQTEGGAFRTIHTAYTSDILPGFPLRSVTPIRPFRRGIRSSNKTARGTIELNQIAIPKTQRIRINRHKMEQQSKDLSSTFIINPPELALKYDEAKQFQEFYKYKVKQTERNNSETMDSSTKVAGIKIQPFKKYQIRGIKKGQALIKESFYND